MVQITELKSKGTKLRHGDISTSLAPIIGIRFENVIYNFGKVNQPGKAYVDRLLSKDINLYFISTLPERKVKAWCYKWGVLYTRVIEVDSTLEIPEICFQNKIMLYIDTDERLLSEVSLRGIEQTLTEKWEQDESRTRTDNQVGGRGWAQ